MSLNNKYHLLERYIASDLEGIQLINLLKSNGYPEGGNNSFTGRWVGFDGNKETDLEGVFDEYLVVSPPGFMFKTKNMSLEEFKTITRTKGSVESEGWRSE